MRPREEPAGKIVVTEYTDPISVWCWGCEPAIRRIECRYPDAVDLRYVMGGLFEDFAPMREYWTRMSGGRWKEAVLTFLTAVGGQHRMPMNVEGMMETMDDFRSTWPACVAVKAADRQGDAAGWRYLRRLREAGLVEGRPIHRREVQIAAAGDAGLDLDRFVDALEHGSADTAFREDLAVCRAQKVQGFPTFDVQFGLATIRLEGYQPWESFDQTLRTLNPALAPRAIASDGEAVVDLLTYYRRCATREVAAILGITDDEAEILLEDLEASGSIRRRETGSVLLWESP